VGLLDGRKAIVLGASSGIGWRIAERFAEEGAELIVAARREDRLEKLVEKIGGVAIRCDVSDDSQVKALADAALERWGRIDVAVNSAGLNGPGHIRDLTPEYLQEIAAVLFFGFYYFMRHMGNAMAATGGGSLINITSATAIMVPAGNAAYSGCKAGINFVSKMAALEYGPDQVRVNALAPSFVPTPMNFYGGMKPTDETHVEFDEELPIVQRVRRCGGIPGERHVVFDHRSRDSGGRREQPLPTAALEPAPAPKEPAYAARVVFSRS
jgi:3-oxoacyl-[acyl-carrier protein] reductase